MTVDTKKKFTVVTQFISSGSSLSEIKRFYVQDGKVIPNSESTISGNTGNSITPDFCKTQKTAFGDQDIFNQKGGFDQFSKALSSGMVLVMSLWDDHYANMLWLDSTYPVDASPDEPGKGRGTCETSSGVPSDIETSQASDQVIYCESCFPTPFYICCTNIFCSQHQVRSHQLDLHCFLSQFHCYGNREEQAVGYRGAYLGYRRQDDKTHIDNSIHVHISQHIYVNIFNGKTRCNDQIVST